jgi:hypothetical protein
MLLCLGGHIGVTLAGRLRASVVRCRCTELGGNEETGLQAGCDLFSGREAGAAMCLKGWMARYVRLADDPELVMASVSRETFFFARSVFKAGKVAEISVRIPKYEIQGFLLRLVSKR